MESTSSREEEEEKESGFNGGQTEEAFLTVINTGEDATSTQASEASEALEPVLKDEDSIGSIDSIAYDLRASNTNFNAANESSRPGTAKLMKLIDILNSSIGSKDATDKHQLNLNMLYNLLLALLEKLEMKDTAVPVNGVTLPTTNELIKGISRENAAVTEMWNVIQLQKQTEANRDGINKLMEITTDILAQLGGIDDVREQMDGMSGKIGELSLANESMLELAEKAKTVSESAMAATETLALGGGGGGVAKARKDDGRRSQLKRKDDDSRAAKASKGESKTRTLPKVLFRTKTGRI